MAGRSIEAAPATTLGNVRRFLLLLYVMGIVGTAADLLLTGHFEDLWQLAPLALMAVSGVVIIWLASTGSHSSLRVHQVMMALFIVSGFLGTFFHLKANIEFETEMYPGLAGFELYWKAIQGASPPSLAPGAMIALGLLGLIYVYRYPSREPNSTDRIGAPS